jgi:heme exporter protein D
MIWESWSDFFAMGGYALYVWGSFVVVFGCMAGEVMLLTQRSKSIHAQLVNARASNAPRTRSKQ